MVGAYWISVYREIRDQAKLDAYVELAVPAIEAGGGRFVARGKAVAAYESGMTERTTLIAFDSVEQAVATHDGPAYQEALRALGDGVDRDIRIVEAQGG
ncbi:hypothetical protein Acsp06_10430 [Actinomycetospora sp. NBRC 106375]|uniref:DUF1330 domain-containing protein n=1 Tax=Actinomycetospora sp. NBRC 106375 TaxID=3032207 RepID=UPI0024A2453F|nr:DUF1330 domain-containing protein [Actinomycetospora sp. NBRC 106375]GLZ44858.1 hypothetical protein Acsp06_10430 [Actinomycetospora sp. NBRC 106375]